MEMVFGLGLSLLSLLKATMLIWSVLDVVVLCVITNAKAGQGFESRKWPQSLPLLCLLSPLRISS